MAGLIYLGLFIFSAVFALAAFIFGHDHDADHDVDTDHDVDGGGMPSVFSSRVISLFLLGFSGMGLVATYAWKFEATGSAGLGLASGVVMGALAYFFMAIFYREQATSHTVPEDYVGLEGRVTANIPQDGTGEVTLTVKEQLRTVFATSVDGGAIPEGRSVTVVKMSGLTATVERVGKS